MTPTDGRHGCRSTASSRRRGSSPCVRRKNPGTFRREPRSRSGVDSGANRIDT
jgi:hypothetical protein